MQKPLSLGHVLHWTSYYTVHLLSRCTTSILFSKIFCLFQRWRKASSILFNSFIWYLEWTEEFIVYGRVQQYKPDTERSENDGFWCLNQAPILGIKCDEIDVKHKRQLPSKNKIAEESLFSSILANVLVVLLLVLWLATCSLACNRAIASASDKLWLSRASCCSLSSTCSQLIHVITRSTNYKLS